VRGFFSALENGYTNLSYLQPGIVWFTEPLLAPMRDWNDPPEQLKTIDTMFVVGSSALVYPVTAYIERVRRKSARIPVVDVEEEEKEEEKEEEEEEEKEEKKEDPSLLGLERAGIGTSKEMRLYWCQKC
jgi:NAD-dependent SIR2 family protein deacetylase